MFERSKPCMPRSRGHCSRPRTHSNYVVLYDVTWKISHRSLFVTLLLICEQYVTLNVQCTQSTCLAPRSISYNYQTERHTNTYRCLHAPVTQCTSAFKCTAHIQSIKNKQENYDWWISKDVEGKGRDIFSEKFLYFTEGLKKARAAKSRTSALTGNIWTPDLSSAKKRC
jgi:hypothetical protein